MKRPVPRLAASQGERITMLEARSETTDEKLDGVDTRVQKIETRVDEIYTLLIQAKGVIWLCTKIFGWIVGSAAVIGVTIAVVKFFTGR